ncbi:peptidylprolyl isomerase [Seonamhaeicola sp. ML3]|uniref:peptidylprolyl isomerase n=1 Tax=Seonamhaeicola sp. ML3 TaxID=2937786 RepID=UPI00200C1993|nr:peptidylprolyl isomerase [Seonamhaeicola sp. ML3]
MKLKFLFTFFSFLFLTSVNSQNTKDEVLFTVGEDSIMVSEFLRVYNKNLDLVQDESQRDIDEYLKLFTSYKLKIKEAKRLGLHKKPDYLQELDKYKKQLAQSYMRDPKVTDALLEEAYERLCYEIKADHILVKVPQNASPRDTLAAYNKLVKLRERALEEGFEKVRSEVHNGKTVFGEKLGYFSGFKMVYPFESAAYNTPVDSISQPFRTRFGYHIVKVYDKIKSRGEVTVAHIMTMNKAGDSVSKPEVKIKEVYNKLQQGESFESLAKQFSEDTSSADKGGELEPFESSQISAVKFEEVAFSLVNEGDVSEPFQSAYGWHIVKLLNRKLVPPYLDMKSELEAKVKRDDRSKLIDEALYTSLKQQYGVKDNDKALQYFETILNEDFFKRLWKLPAGFKADEALVNIGDKQLIYQDFGSFLIELQKGRVYKRPIKAFVEEQYEAFLNKNLVSYKESKLEEENVEYANILSEYRDGLLLFDLMENTIWNTSETDSISIRDFYEKNKNKYIVPEQIDAIVASASKQGTLKKVSKYLEQGKRVEDIKELINTDKKVKVIFSSDIMDAKNQALPEKLPFKKGVSEIYKHNDAYVLVKINDVIPQAQKSFDDAKGSVISDYQTQKEITWIDNLRAEFSVVVNQDVLEKVKSKLKK